MLVAERHWVMDVAPGQLVETAIQPTQGGSAAFETQFEAVAFALPPWRQPLFLN